jgi:hypothetical protein
MKLYLAGNPGHGEAGKYREQIMSDIGKNVMVSFFWCQEDGDFYKYFRRLINSRPKIPRHGMSNNTSN